MSSAFWEQSLRILRIPRISPDLPGLQTLAPIPGQGNCTPAFRMTLVRKDQQKPIKPPLPLESMQIYTISSPVFFETESKSSRVTRLGLHQAMNLGGIIHPYNMAAVLASAFRSTCGGQWWVLTRRIRP